MTSFRKERVSDMVLSVVAESVRRMNDPRFSCVTITGVEMSADLKNAHVYWTTFDRAQNGEIVPNSFPSEGRINDVLAAFRSAEHLLKRELGEELKLRYTPKLIFEYDKSTATGYRIDELLQKINR